MSHWLDDVARMVALKISRRQALRWAGGGLGAAGLAGLVPTSLVRAVVAPSAIIPLPLQSAADPDWIKVVPPGSGGECMPLNPDVTSFVDIDSPDLDPGVRIDCASTTSACCTCIAEAKPFVLGSPLSTATTHFTASWFSADRGPDDPFSVASLSLVLVSGVTPVASGIFVAEMRPNNNCKGAYPPPEHLVPNDGPIDIPLSILAPAASFDAIVVALQGYACATGTNSLELAGTQLETA